MKKAIFIISIITLFFVGCKKDDIAEASKLSIETETIEKGWDYVKINVEYDYPVALEAVTLYLSEKEDMSGAEAYECNVDGNKFSVEVEGLKEGVAYYYCYEYDNGYEEEKGEKQNINTVSKPVVITKEVSDVNTVSATLNGSVTNNDAINEISEMGFCWDTKQNPTIEGSHYNKGGMSGTGTSGFSYNLTSLVDNKTYYVRTYAKTNFGIVYGEEKSFTTVEIVLPTVTTNTVTNIKATTATCGGNITSDGNGIITARGVCWSTSQNPTIEDNKTTNGGGIGSYSSYLSNLSDKTTYYVRAYATNEKGTSYGEEKSFTTLEGTFENGYEYVDLGLSVKWATCNIGATSPEAYGDYFAWGETTTKSDYSSSNCPTYGLSISQLQSQGYIDGEGNLTAQYDAATANWGGDWRMPTYDELNELRRNCTWTWTTQNGVNGYNVEGPNGNSIFLPAAGYCIGSSPSHAGGGGYYWSSTPYEYDDDTYYYAYRLVFVNDFFVMDYAFRDFGWSVRPVVE